MVEVDREEQVAKPKRGAPRQADSAQEDRDAAAAQDLLGDRSQGSVAQVRTAVRAHRDQVRVELVRMLVERDRDIAYRPLVHVHFDLDPLAAKPCCLVLEVALRIACTGEVRLAVHGRGRVTFENMQQEHARAQSACDRGGHRQRGFGEL